MKTNRKYFFIVLYHIILYSCNTQTGHENGSKIDVPVITILGDSLAEYKIYYSNNPARADMKR